jgi:hypothetical protein
LFFFCCGPARVDPGVARCPHAIVFASARGTRSRDLFAAIWQRYAEVMEVIGVVVCVVVVRVRVD